MMKLKWCCLVVLLGAVGVGSARVDAADRLEDAALFGVAAAVEGGGPHVPEPMVFDLVRPLGARKGELEVNTLAIFPFNRRRTGSGRASDELGMTPLSSDRGQVEWAPEIEFALWDGFALEFEFPFEGRKLEEYKAAAQWTAGVGLGGRFIHGFQGIVERARESTTTTWTGVWIGALRWSERWSMLGMWGASHETGAGIGEMGGGRTQILQNLSLFYDVSERWHAGLETNYALATSGASTLLLMPQVQINVGKQWSAQMGVGAAFSESEVLPQLGLRVIWSY